MARLDFEKFLDEEVTRVYLAGGFEEARRVESILTEHDIDYIVDVEPYSKSGVLGIFPNVYSGAAFFVVSGQAPFARSALLAAGLKAGIEDDQG